MAGWRRKLKVLRGLLAGETAHTGPDYVNIDVTHRCNLRCFYCRWHSPLVEQPRLQRGADRDLSCDLFRELCRDLRALGSTTLQLVGAGEPLLHPEIFEMIRIAKDNRLTVLMYTNGTLLDEDRVQSLTDSGLDVLRVSLAATSKDEYVHKHPHATPQEFDRIVSGLQLLAMAKATAATASPVVELAHPIPGNGAASIPAAMELAAATGCAKVRYSPVLDFGEARIRPFTLRDDEQAVVREQLRRAARRGVELGIQTNLAEVLLRYRLGADVWSTMPCYLAWFGSFVGTDGSVRICQRSQAAVGRLSQNRFAEIWNGQIYRSFRRQCLSGQPPGAWLHHADCSYCPHAVNNYRVHQIFRWLAPLRALTFNQKPDTSHQTPRDSP